MELLRQRSSRTHTISQLSPYPSKNHVQATQGEGNCPSAIRHCLSMTKVTSAHNHRNSLKSDQIGLTD